jgi:DNA-directed RNA polymerase subunit RPC12/RpoP
MMFLTYINVMLQFAASAGTLILTCYQLWKLIRIHEYQHCPACEYRIGLRGYHLFHKTKLRCQNCSKQLICLERDRRKAR